jgi:hydroxymethylglutaryl-CoA synthase
LDETVHAVEDMLRRLGVSAGTYYESVRGLFFHRPYHLMPVQAMSFLYVRGLARGDHRRDELEALCREANVELSELLRETESTPDLYAHILEGKAQLDPYAATSAAASVLRKQPRFRALLSEKMSLGHETVSNLGNLYSAALPAWLAAGLEDAAFAGTDLDEYPLVAVGYGSGDAAEAMPLRVVPGWRSAAARLGIARALEGAIDLTREQYEALHDGAQFPELSYTPRQEFRIVRVGTSYEPHFQDLGVEYYEYVD